uniref:Quattro n=1 Tax=Anabas testudineus TaxID=64144 RepID=A0A7N6FGR0_ANATE
MCTPESLDSSIQSALSALFPPFETTAPIVLSQLFRTIEELYNGDALQCLLDFLIPSKHLLESVQQAACAGYSDVVFRCEGWPLCLHDKTVIQLAPVNPLLLRPGDFYLQVQPFGDQAARIVLKSLLEEGCREVEETPVPETSYPCIFTEDWLRDINEGRHGTPLSRCLLCTDQGVIKLPWGKIAIPEFLDKPKIMPTYREAPPELKRISVPSHLNSSTLPLEAMIFPAKDRISASLRPADCSSKLVKMEQEKRNPKLCSKPLIKPVGWVSPNTWDSRNYREIEGDYVDLVDISKGKEFVDKQKDSHPNLPNAGLFKPVRPPPPVPLGNSVACGRTLQYAEEPCTPCSQRKRGQDLTDQDFKCRYRDSYLAALRNPVPFERGSADLLTALEEVGLCEEGELRPKGTSEGQRQEPGNISDGSKEAILCNERCQYKHCNEPTLENVTSHLKDPPANSESENLMKQSPMILKSTPGLSHNSLSSSLSSLCFCLLTDSHSSRSQTPSITEGSDSDTNKSPSPQVHLPSASSDTPQSPQREESNFRSISSLLELGIICLPGSRDRTGRAVVEVYGDRKGWMSPLVSAQNVCELLLYLHSIPRKDVQELGMTLIINGRRKPPPLQLYKALLMAQEQALHAVHSIVMLMDKDTSPRPEKQPGLQMDMVTSLKALNKTVEASQLTSELGGTFIYSHTDWLQFHQVLSLYYLSDSLLQKAIKKVDSSKKTDTAEDVHLCIQEQRTLMKEVLEDTRLVTLQREGGALLAKMRKEEFRFPQSEDYRDALESVTSLYNQVEEKLHMLVMRSNESLQQLEFLFRLREMEVGTWFSTDGEQRLKDSYTKDDNMVCAEKALQHFELFLTQSKENRQHAAALIMEAERIVGTSESSPAADVFRTLVSTFKSNVDDFMFRAEQRYKELDTVVHVYRFCDKVCMYDEKLGGEFSTLHFQAQKAKACAVGSGASGVMRVWNAAWVQSQEVRQCLEQMHNKKKGVDKNQIQHSTTASPQEEDGVMQTKEKRNEVGEDECSHEQATFPKEIADASQSVRENGTAACFNHHLEPDLKEESQVQAKPTKLVKNDQITPVFAQNSECNPDTKWRPREHHSEADLRTTDSVGAGDEFPLHKALGRSLSEGSSVSSHLRSISSFSPLNLRHKHFLSRTQPLEQNLQPLPNLPIHNNSSLHSGNLSLDSKTESNEEKALFNSQILHFSFPRWDRKLRRIMDELLFTERDYVKALGYVREHYFPELERPDVPQDLRGQRGSVFGNLEKLHDFHRHHFLNELESCMNEPFRVGRCFLRHRESFALYALYSKNKPQSDSLLINHGQAFFKQKQLKLGDKMDLWSYLLKPVQRISKYSLLLQDMMRECSPAQTREMAEIKAALEVIHFQLRHGNNLLAMDAIHHCDVNLKEQGQLIRQDEFLVTFRKKKCFRHIFLFQDLILFSKTRKTDVGNDTYIYKQSFKTSDIGMTQNSGDSGLCFEIWFRKRKTEDTYTLQAVSREVKEAWTKDLEQILWVQAVHSREVRMQERVFMGIGNKPFMDIQPSDAAISDRAVNYALMGRGEQTLPAIQLQLLVTSFNSEAQLFDGVTLCSESSEESVSGFSSSSHSYHSAIGGEAEDTSSVCASIITVKEAAVAQRADAPAVFHKPNARAGSLEKTQPPVATKPNPKPQNQTEDLPSGKVQYKS